jgi:hypothetical protein
VAHERRHLELEEHELLPAALEKLTAQDWVELDKRLTDAKNPPLSREVEARCDKLSESIIRWEREDQAERAWLSQGR